MLLQQSKFGGMGSLLVIYNKNIKDPAWSPDPYKIVSALIRFQIQLP
jgi:hypothetical protein